MSCFCFFLFVVAGLFLYAKVKVALVRFILYVSAPLFVLTIFLQIGTAGLPALPVLGTNYLELGWS